MGLASFAQQAREKLTQAGIFGQAAILRLKQSTATAPGVNGCCRWNLASEWNPAVVDHHRYRGGGHLVADLPH